MPDLSPETIAAAAMAPAHTEVDGQVVDAVSIPDQIMAANYAAGSVTDPNANGGPRSAWRGVRMGKAIPPGANP